MTTRRVPMTTLAPRVDSRVADSFATNNRLPATENSLDYELVPSRGKQSGFAFAATITL